MFKSSKLQLFAETVRGKKLIYLFRIYEDRKTDTGKLIAFVTENSKSVSKDADSTATKDGTVRTPNEAEIEISCTAILAKGDTMIGELSEAMLSDKLIEIWEANFDEPATSGENKFKGTYYQGYLTSLEKSSSSDGFVECSLTFGINGTGADGDVTVPEDQQEVASYVFSDTTTATS